ncbi:hypothetical protein NA56DRAFT_612283 [Hyaloscypha hepaticicola]|uniref:Heterokaryon incompatibility domain-containing protein n=1 Tax=Hyaloscypha hepaticicola TaxID=2082293 RepID=A0A2J6PHE0_9HELO|nr:hypothetical protein NA56DRAFT_612283 [Hyaloscypha hepaticicola]
MNEEWLQASGACLAAPEQTLPTLSDEGGGENLLGDQGGIETSERREKLNLLKCKRCRDARKKCRANHVWPQKSEKCLSQGLVALRACSEPALKNPRGTLDLSEVDLRSETSLIAGRLDPQINESDDYTSSDEPKEPSTFEGPRRTAVLKRIKREHPKAAPETQPPALSDEDQFPTSVYTPLAAGEFRILQLAPGRHDDDICCSFMIASMAESDKVKYEAISYLWGSPRPQQLAQINLLDPHGKVHPINIRINLFHALRRLRHPKKMKPMWIDALCIDRKTTHEMNTQVSMKRYLFRNAQNLCFWIGEDEDCKNALKFIPRILDLFRIDKLIRDDSAIDDWAAFVALLKNPVWSRLWILQEVAVSQNTTLHCGQVAIHYGDLVDAMALFRTCQEQISILFRHNQKNENVLLDRRLSVAERFIDVSMNVFRPTSSGNVERLLSLETLVCYLSDLDCADPLDRIYSVLAISKDGPAPWGKTPIEHDMVLHIDYDKSVLDVYQEFVVQTIKTSHSLDIICRNWASRVPQTEVHLPTWVRPLQFSSQQNANIGYISERIEADSMVGLPGKNYYNASGGRKTIFYLEDSQPRYIPCSLSVCGLRVDTISNLGPRAEEGIILQEWFELGQCDLVLDELPDAFWMTLVAGRGPKGSTLPSWYNRAFKYCLLLSPTGNINTNRIIDEMKSQSPLVVDFLRRVQSVIWNRKFFVSSNKYIGLAPPAAQVGDFICILYGCSVPVVLRRQEDMNGKGFFQVVGESYVHRIMDGEALATAKASGIFEEDFELR